MEIDLKRHGGAEGISVAECIDKHIGTWRVRTDFLAEEGEENQGNVTFIETEFPYKPSMDEVREFCLGVINAQTDMKILTGFVWTPEGGNPINVWLSAENQRNFSEAERKAAANPLLLPLTFKLGEDANGEAVYHTFETIEELSGFYDAAFIYINQCLQEGWQKKDNFDFTPYEPALNPVVTE